MIARMFSLVLAVGTVLAGSVTAHADEARFAVVTINNRASDVTIHLSYRWGNGNWQELKHFKPNSSEWFAIPLDKNGHAPHFEIKLNEAIGNNPAIVKQYNLKWKKAPDRATKFGHQYEIVRDSSDRDYVSFYDQQK